MIVMVLDCAQHIDFAGNVLDLLDNWNTCSVELRKELKIICRAAFILQIFKYVQINLFWSDQNQLSTLPFALDLVIQHKLAGTWL